MDLSIFDLASFDSTTLPLYTWQVFKPTSLQVSETLLFTWLHLGSSNLRPYGSTSLQPCVPSVMLRAWWSDDLRLCKSSSHLIFNLVDLQVWISESSTLSFNPVSTWLDSLYKLTLRNHSTKLSNPVWIFEPSSRFRILLTTMTTKVSWEQQ